MGRDAVFDSSHDSMSRFLDNRFTARCTRWGVRFIYVLAQIGRRINHTNRVDAALT